MIIPVGGKNFAISATCIYHVYLILTSFIQATSKCFFFYLLEQLNKLSLEKNTMIIVVTLSVHFKSNSFYTHKKD